jgi:hypothetical protein
MTDTNQVEKKWFIYVKDHHEGPFSVAEILEGVRTGRFAEPAYVWHQQLPDWMSIHDLPDFQVKPPEFSKSPPQFKAAQHHENEESVGDSSPRSSTSNTNPDLVVEIRPLQSKNRAELSPLSVEESERSRVVQPEYVSADHRDHPREESTQTSDYTLGGTLKKKKKVFANKKQFQIIFLVVAFSVLGVSVWTQPSLLSRLNQVLASFRPFPHLTDVSPVDYETLRQTVRYAISTGVAVEVAVSTSDPISPSFYVATNLSTGARFDVYVVGVGESLLNILKFEGKLAVQTENGLGKTSSLRFPDGKVIPRGEYRLFVVEAQGEQPSSVQAQLAQIVSTPKSVPPTVPKDRKILYEKSIFWGEKDQTYLSRLKDFHDKLNEKSAQEVAEISQMLSLLETQLQKSTSDFDRLKNQALGPKQIQAWIAASQTWNQFANQTTQALSKVVPVADTLEWVHIQLYQHLKKINSEIIRLRQLEDSFFSQKVPLAQIAPEDSALRANLEKNMLELKGAITLLEQAPKNPQGLPNEVVVRYSEVDLNAAPPAPVVSGSGTSGVAQPSPLPAVAAPWSGGSKATSVSKPAPNVRPAEVKNSPVPPPPPKSATGISPAAKSISNLRSLESVERDAGSKVNSSVVGASIGAGTSIPKKGIVQPAPKPVNKVPPVKVPPPVSGNELPFDEESR